MAEMAKQHIKRKCALQFGDSGSHVVPLASCSGCDDPISDANRSCIYGKCFRCLTEDTALKSMEIANRNRATDEAVNAKDRRWIFTGIVCLIVIGAVALYLWKAGVL